MTSRSTETLGQDAAPQRAPLAEAPPYRPPGVLALVLWIVVIVGLGATMGMLFGPGDWYRGLQKPAWNPPSWLFGPVWTTLYTIMAVALWLMRRAPGAHPDLRERATWLFLIQFLFNLTWTPLFFGLRNPGLAFAEVCGLWLLVAATLYAFYRVRPLAGLLLVPYLAWVSFALALNGAIWRLNPGVG